MKKCLILSVILVCFMSFTILANTYDISEIANVKVITDYDRNATVKDFDSVTFGSYPQSDENGESSEPIEWIVLDKKDDKVFLLSKYILDCDDYNNTKTDVTWEESYIREFLNDYFYYVAFDRAEQNIILNKKIVNNDTLNKVIGGEKITPAGNNTTDKIFLLSIDEAEKYFLNYKYELATKATNFAKRPIYRKNGISKRLNDKAFLSNGCSSYWLRSPGLMEYEAAFISEYGTIFKLGHDVFGNDMLGIRPAMWISADVIATQTKETTTEEITRESIVDIETIAESTTPTEIVSEEVTKESIVSIESISESQSDFETQTEEVTISTSTVNIVETTEINKVVPEETTKKEKIKRKDYSTTKSVWMYWYIEGNTIHFSSKESKLNHDDKGIYYKTAYSTKPNGECFDNDGNMIGPSAEQRKMIIKAIFDDKIDALYCSGIFNHYENLIEIENLNYLNTKNVKTMSTMFQHCHSLQKIDLSNFDTKNVTNMGAMFSYCKSLTDLDVSKFDTKNVKDMSGLFNRCEKLKQINIQNFNTENVTNMMQMFYGCKEIVELDLSSFNTKNVKSMARMFSDCSKLKTIYASNKFVTNNVSGKDRDGFDAANNLFDECLSLVGGNGTKYNKDHTDKKYAQIDSASTPGYFTLK